MSSWRPSNKEPPAEISLDFLYLQLIPNSLNSALIHIQNNSWNAAVDALDFVWSVLPPKTSTKFPVRPSTQLEEKMEIAKRIAARRLNPKDNEIRQGETIEFARNRAGMEFCYQWIRTVVNQLAKDGYLFEAKGVVMTEDRKATEQPPSTKIEPTLPRR